MQKIIRNHFVLYMILLLVGLQLFPKTAGAEAGWLSQAKALDTLGIFPEYSEGYTLEKDAETADAAAILQVLKVNAEENASLLTPQGYAAALLKALHYTEADFKEDALGFCREQGFLPEGDYAKLSAMSVLTRGGLADLTYQLLFASLKDDSEATLLEKLYLNDASISKTALLEAASGSTKVAEIAQKLNLVKENAKALTPNEIARRVLPAVFYLITYDANDHPVQSGSGFFIEENGLAVTNAHVLSGAVTAEVLLDDDTLLKVKGILALDKAKDLALIQVEGDAFPTVTLADSDNVATGDRIYTIGSPYGLSNTFTEGLVSRAARSFKVGSYIQISAPTAQGSSGGVLLNDHGEVIGVVTATMGAGQNFNFVTPSNLLKDLKAGNLIALADNKE